MEIKKRVDFSKKRVVTYLQYDGLYYLYDILNEKTWDLGHKELHELEKFANIWGLTVYQHITDLDDPRHFQSLQLHILRERLQNLNEQFKRFNDE